MGFPTRYFLDNISDCGKSYTHNVIFYFGGALGLRLWRGDGSHTTGRCYTLFCAAVPKTVEGLGGISPLVKSAHLTRGGIPPSPTTVLGTAALVRAE